MQLVTTGIWAQRDRLQEDCNAADHRMLLAAGHTAVVVCVVVARIVVVHRTIARVHCTGEADCMGRQVVPNESQETWRRFVVGRLAHSIPQPGRCWRVKWGGIPAN
jgi:hypothetical protein